ILSIPIGTVMSRLPGPRTPAQTPRRPGTGVWYRQNAPEGLRIMTQTGFVEQACRRFRSKLYSYIDNELRTESNLEMMEHFRRCAPCTQAAEERRNVRKRLQNAVRGVKEPPGLEGRVRDRL